MIVENQIGAIRTLAISLPLNDEVVDELAETANNTVEQGHAQLVIDLQQVPVIESRGLEILLDIQDLCLKRGGALKLVASSGISREILAATRLDEMIEIYPTAIDAVGSYSE